MIVVAQTNDFDMGREWYARVGEDPFQGLPHEDPRNHIEKLEDLVSRSEQNKVFEYHMLCKIFPYSISRDAFSWFSQLQPGSLTSWEDIERAFLYQFLDDVEATREREKYYKWDKLVESWQIKREYHIPRHLFDYVIAKGNEKYGSVELSRVDKADISYPTSASIDITTSTSIDTNFCCRSTPLESSGYCRLDTSEHRYIKQLFCSRYRQRDHHGKFFRAKGFLEGIGWSTS